MTSLLMTLCLLAASPPPADEETKPLERTHTIAGEVTRLHLGQKTVAIKVTKPRREYVVAIDSDKTRIVSMGRSMRLEDIPIGARAYVVCEDDPHGRHVARLLRISKP
jgi:hypothetical protein